MKYYILPILACVLILSCTEDEGTAISSSAIELTGVRTVIGEMPQSRADDGTTPSPSVKKTTPGYIGRELFIGGDKMTLTKFCRTEVSMDSYSYSNLGFESNSDGAWNRTSTDPDRIYWTDNSNPHTFIGFSCPQAWYEGGELKTDKWRLGTGVGEDMNNYFGHFSYDDNNIVDFSDSAKIVTEDLLLTYDTEKQADPGGSVATLHYKHALASARVVVNIMNFAPDDKSEDVKTKVSDLQIEEQPWKYKWAQMPIDNVNGINHPGWGVQMLEPTGSEPANVTLKTWLDNENGTGINRNKTFTFRSLIVPGRQEQVKFSFDVEYPDALNPATTKRKTYHATLTGGVFFEPGKTTTIRISLNHQNEGITIGAEYIDWENEETPNQTSLAKYSTYLATTNRDAVTIAGDSKATIEDATWLYMNNDSKLVDIYNNDGTEAKPFTIKTALQFLSFAYEVNNGRSFEGQYIKLDASLVLQGETEPSDAASTSWATTNWIGVGDASHAFNGTFIGTSRYVRYLKGAPLFTNIGSNGKVCGLTLENVLGVTSGGMLAANNAGTICACIANINTTNSFSAYDGLCSTNSGKIVACGTIGPNNATQANAGICGTNSGDVVACYSGIKSKAGVVATGSAVGCYYDSDKASGTTSDGSTGMTTERMQLQSFVTTLNNALDTWCGTEDSRTHLKSHRFLFRAAYYPKVE